MPTTSIPGCCCGPPTPTPLFCGCQFLGRESTPNSYTIEIDGFTGDCSKFNGTWELEYTGSACEWFAEDGDVSIEISDTDLIITDNTNLCGLNYSTDNLTNGDVTFTLQTQDCECDNPPGTLTATSSDDKYDCGCTGLTPSQCQSCPDANGDRIARKFTLRVPFVNTQCNPLIAGTVFSEYCNQYSQRTFTFTLDPCTSCTWTSDNKVYTCSHPFPTPPDTTITDPPTDPAFTLTVNGQKAYLTTPADAFLCMINGNLCASPPPPEGSCCLWILLGSGGGTQNPFGCYSCCEFAPDVTNCPASIVGNHPKCVDNGNVLPCWVNAGPCNNFTFQTYVACQCEGPLVSQCLGWIFECDDFDPCGTNVFEFTGSGGNGAFCLPLDLSNGFTLTLVPEDCDCCNNDTVSWPLCPDLCWEQEIHCTLSSDCPAYDGIDVTLTLNGSFDCTQGNSSTAYTGVWVDGNSVSHDVSFFITNGAGDFGGDGPPTGRLCVDGIEQRLGFGASSVNCDPLLITFDNVLTDLCASGIDFIITE